MGTSLSGLTPATTFDGLLKVGDNDPLTADLKAISTGDGTDTILSLSNSALQISGETTMISDTGTFLKINDTINPSQEFSINKPFSTLEMFDLGTSANTKLRLYNTYLRFQVGGATTRLSLDISGNLGLGIENSTAAARTHIKGSGVDSTTTSLLVQNSAGTELLKVQDDGLIQAQNLKIDASSTLPLLYAENSTKKSLKLGNQAHLSAFSTIDFKTYDGTDYTEAMRITGVNDQFVGIGETTPTARLHIKGSGNDNTTTSLLVQNSDAADMLKVADDGQITIGQTDLQGKINIKRASGGLQVGEISGEVKGLLLNGYDGTSVFIGRSSNEGVTINNGGFNHLGASLGVKGFGATSATTALLVQNSAGTELLKVLDGGADKQVRMNSALIGSLEFVGTSIATGGGNPITMQFNPLHIGGATGAELAIKGTGNDATTTALLVQNSDGTDMLKVTDDGATTIQSNFGVSGGDVAVFQNSADPTNQFKINKRDDSTNIWYTGTTNTEIEYRDTIHFRFNLGGVTQMQLRNSGNLGLGVGSANASARMHIKGSGATSATTALLVQNSAGTDLFKVQDDGNISLGSISIKGSIITGNAYFSSIVYGPNYYRQTSGATTIGGGTGADASAQLDVRSTTKGFLPPRMTDSERDAITTPAPGLMVYDTSNNQMNYWNGTTWIAF